MSNIIKYRVLLEDNYEIFEPESILTKIPTIKTMIEELRENKTILDKYNIDFRGINSITFGHILALVKYNSTNLEKECEYFNNNFIKNMNVNTLMDFITLSHNLGLENYKQLAINRFLNIFNKNSIEGIRKEFKLIDDFSDRDRQNIKIDNEWLEEKY